MTMNGSWWYTPEIVLKPVYPDPTPPTVTVPTPNTSTPQTPTTAIPEPDQPGNQEQTPARESLPVTGVQIGALLIIIAALLASGIGLIVSGRKKKKDAESSPNVGDDGGSSNAGVETDRDVTQDTESGEFR